MNARLAPLAAWWRTREPRERLILGIGGAVLALVLLFVVAVQPAWRTLRAAPAERAAQDAQWQEMQRLAAEAAELRAAPPVSPEQSAAALRAASERLGASAHLALQGERAVLALSGTSSAQLRDWLAEVRSAARARPVEANLTRGPNGLSGSIVVVLGGQP